MRITTQAARLLGLRKEERKVLLCLESTPKSTAELAKNTLLPRTTLLRTLQNLHNRGILRKQKTTSRRSGWLIVSNKILEGSLKTLSSDLGVERDEGEPVIVKKDEHEVVVYRGEREMLELAHTADSFSSGERVLWLRSNKLWDEWLRHGYRKRIIEVIRHFREKGIVTEFILGENFIRSDLEHGGEKLLKEYRDYPAIVHTIPEGYLNFYSDVMVFRNAVSIMNWKDEVAVLIKNRDLVLFFKNIFNYIENNSKRVNIGELAGKHLGGGKN